MIGVILFPVFSVNMIKKINISTPKYKNQYAVVDSKFFDYLNQWKWRTHSKGYAVRMSWDKKLKRSKIIYMHRLINKTPKGLETDHINRNKLDNRGCNLRSVNGTINKINTGLWKHSTTGYKGVTWSKSLRKWQSQIGIGNKNILIGYFNSIKDATIARVNFERSYLWPGV
jgi:hypothetical protein